MKQFVQPQKLYNFKYSDNKKGPQHSEKLSRKGEKTVKKEERQM